MTTYEILTSQELLDQFRRDASKLPAGFRVGAVTAHPVRHGGEPPSFQCSYVQVEDDAAPVELEGQLVELVFQDHYDDAGNRAETVILDRRVGSRAIAGYVKASG